MNKSVLISFVLILFISISTLQAQNEVLVHPDDGYYYHWIIENVHYKQVLDASAGTKGKVQLWKNMGDSDQYTKSAANQKWRLRELKDGTYIISNNYHYSNNASMVLDASAGTKGKVQLWENSFNSSQYAPNANNQKWRFIPLGNNVFKIENVHFNMVLDASAGTKGKVQLWNNAGNSNQYVPNANNQKWKITKVKGAKIVLH